MSANQKEIRVIIPSFNSGNTIVRCVEAVLESLKFHSSWEIVIVDNGKNPNLKHLFEKYSVAILKRDEYPSAAYARNEGAKDFRSGLLIFIDSDVICEPDCMVNLIQPVQSGSAHASIGNYSRNLNGLSFSQKYKQLYINHIYSRAHSKIRNDFWTAICCVDSKVFHFLNGFDANFRGANGEDQEFGIRLTKNGFHVEPVNIAKGQHLNPYGISEIIKNDFRKGMRAVKNSIENSVPLSDNRHSGKMDILSVLFSVLTIFFLSISFISLQLIGVASLLFLLWFVCRFNLNLTFLKHGGIWFFISALTLMFVLDLVRFICVVLSYCLSIIRKFQVIDSSLTTSTVQNS